MTIIELASMWWGTGILLTSLFIVLSGLDTHVMVLRCTTSTVLFAILLFGLAGPILILSLLSISLSRKPLVSVELKSGS